MEYDIIPNNDKDYWIKTLANFTNLYAMRKVYSEDRSAESGFNSVDSVTHIGPPESVINVSLKLNRSCTMGNIILMED